MYERSKCFYLNNSFEISRNVSDQKLTISFPTFNVWRLLAQRVEDVDEDEEEGREKGHPGGNDVRRNQETCLFKI
jgi:hypothetical protein